MTVSLMPERLPYVRFETRALEDRAKSIVDGRYVAKDVHFVIIQPAGSKDTVEKPVDTWLSTFNHPSKMQVGAQYRAMYDAWRNGQEIPVNGTALKTWPALSPAEIENIIACNVRTVEDLAAADENTLRRIGMGARGHKQRAQAWLDASKDTGKTAAELDSLRAENARQKERLDELERMVAELQPKKRGPKPRKDDPEE